MDYSGLWSFNLALGFWSWFTQLDCGKGNLATCAAIRIEHDRTIIIGNTAVAGISAKVRCGQSGADNRIVVVIIAVGIAKRLIGGSEDVGVAVRNIAVEISRCL